MFLKLPLDIQDKIYKSLSVQDRVKLNMALPKESKTRYKSLNKEKQLGLITKVIKKRKIEKVSYKMKCFLAEVESEDPTLKDISEILPIVKEINKKTVTNLDNIETLTKEEIFSITNKLTIEQFDRLLKNPYMINIINYDIIGIYIYERQGFLFNLLLDNHIIFDYIVEKNICDIECIRKSLKFAIISKKNYEFILKHFKLSKEELEEIFDYVVERLNFELIDIIGRQLELI